MALSRLAQQFAAEIAQHDWSDAPYRIDRAGHSRDGDTPAKRSQEVLTTDETRRVRMNVMWVTAQVLGYNDPNFDVYEFAEACGIDTRNSRGGRNGVIDAGLRNWYGEYMRPGTWEFDPVTEVITTETSDDYHASAQCTLFRSGYKGAPLLRFPSGQVPAKWKPCQCMSLNRH